METILQTDYLRFDRNLSSSFQVHSSEENVTYWEEEKKHFNRDDTDNYMIYVKCVDPGGRLGRSNHRDDLEEDTQGNQQGNGDNQTEEETNITEIQKQGEERQQEPGEEGGPSEGSLNEKRGGGGGGGGDSERATQLAA